MTPPQRPAPAGPGLAHPGHGHPAHPHAGHPHPERSPERVFVLRVGLTGGIATGKSTVAQIFSELGAIVLDADRIAHRLIERGQPGYDPVVQAFGDGILRPDGSIERPHLGRIIFADPEKRALLESILHPMLRAEEAAIIEPLAETGQSRVAVTNAALLIETGIYRDYHRVIVVHCARDTQVERIVRRDQLTEEEALVRIGAQMDTAEKLKVAHYKIDTTAGFAATQSRAREVFRHLQLDLDALGRKG